MRGGSRLREAENDVREKRPNRYQETSFAFQNDLLIILVVCVAWIGLHLLAY